MTDLDTTDLERQVKEMYRRVADEPGAEFHFEMGRDMAERLGYRREDLDRIPAEAIESFAGVGCPLAIASLTSGERVLDLGSGSGMDTFVAALHVGRDGVVVGIDMTDAQRDKAARLRDRDGFTQVRYQDGRIEDPPVEPGSFDCVISNGVINLSPDKPSVFRAIVAALRAGGRMAISDIVTDVELPEGIVCDANLWAACIGGAMQRDRFRAEIERAGLRVATLRDNPEYHFLSSSAQGATERFGVKSVSILAHKPE